MRTHIMLVVVLIALTVFVATSFAPAAPLAADAPMRGCTFQRSAAPSIASPTPRTPRWVDYCPKGFGTVAASGTGRATPSRPERYYKKIAQGWPAETRGIETPRAR